MAGASSCQSLKYLPFFGFIDLFYVFSVFSYSCWWCLMTSLIFLLKYLKLELPEIRSQRIEVRRTSWSTSFTLVAMCTRVCRSGTDSTTNMGLRKSYKTKSYINDRQCQTYQNVIERLTDYKLSGTNMCWNHHINYFLAHSLLTHHLNFLFPFILLYFFIWGIAF